MKIVTKFALSMSSAFLLMSCASSQTDAAKETSAEAQVETIKTAKVAQESSESLTIVEIKPNLRENEVICKSVDNTGSKLKKKKTCATRKQWESRGEQDRTQFELHRKRSTYGS